MSQKHSQCTCNNSAKGAPEFQGGTCMIRCKNCNGVLEFEELASNEIIQIECPCCNRIFPDFWKLYTHLQLLHQFNSINPSDDTHNFKKANKNKINEYLYATYGEILSHNCTHYIHYWSQNNRKCICGKTIRRIFPNG